MLTKKKKKDEKKRRRRKFDAESFYRFLTFLVAFVIVVGVLSHDRDDYEWKIQVKRGEPASHDVYAPFTFSYVNDERTQMAKRAAMDRVLPVYKVDSAINEGLRQKVADLFALADSARVSEEKISLPEKFSTMISTSSFTEIIGLKEKEYLEFQDQVLAGLNEFLSHGLVSFSKKVDLLDSDQRMVTAISESGGEEDVSILDLKTLSEVRDEIYRTSLSLFSRNRRLRSAYTDLLTSFLSPNLVFDDLATDKKREQAMIDTPPVTETVQKNESIVRKGHIITYSDIQRLKEIEQKITNKKVALDVIGLGIIVFFFLLILAAYLYHFEKKIYYSLNDVILINTAICFNVILDKMILSVVDANFAVYLIPSSIASLLLCILLKPRIGFCVAIGMSIMSGVMTDYNGLIMITTLLTSLLGVYMLIDVRRRSQFFVVGALVGLVNFITVAAFLLLQEMSFQDALNKAVYAIGNGGIIVVLLFPLVWLFEKVFDKTTSISLLELSDLNHPLLKRLIIEAPGTYHHSLVVSNLAESAAEAIGADSLLARVGAYYHDIGKIAKAGYFTENQTAKDRNYHDALSPRMSYFIIMNHVKDGIALATHYKLKNVIVDFIRQHHGTGVVYFFYKKAIDEKKDDEKLDISDFRYPGPKPQTKEIAITLLADSVEAASRSLAEPTPASLRGLVEKVINDKFLDNQLDECELTLLDLHKIRDSFVRNLMAIFHTRVEYPEMISESTQRGPAKS